MMENKIRAERLSSLLDGELDEKELDALLLALNDEDALQDWDSYQQIGVALRGEAHVAMSSDFATRVAAQLQNEPAHSVVAATTLKTPVAQPVVESNLVQRLSKKWLAFAAAAGAAVTALTMVSAPQVMVALNGDEKASSSAPVQLAATKPVTLLANSVSQAPVPDASMNQIGQNAATVQFGEQSGLPVLTIGGQLTSVETTRRLIADGKPVEVVYLRDPLIDQYLLAHQRFSPSVYSTAQYARSAAFANEKDK